MAIPFLNNITIDDAGHIQFKTAAGANAGKIDQDGNNLVLSNAVGDILLGDGSSDVYIGDGTNNVDIIFEQSGSIKGDGSAVTLTLGGANTTLNLENPNFSGNIGMSSKLTFTTTNGYILFDHEPSGDTGAYDGNVSVPLLKVDRSGNEMVILERVSEYGALLLGNDDAVIIAGGDTRTTLRGNLNENEETVFISAEGGMRVIGFPDNMSGGWSARQEFRFYTGGTDASSNGLWIGSAGTTQFIDLNRNLKNIGTITSGAISATGDSIMYGKTTVYKSSSHTAQGSFSASDAHLDLYNPLEANTDQKGSIITFTDNYYGGSSYHKTTRAAIKGGTDSVGNTADGYLEFYTDSGSANTPTLALRLDHDQNATFSNHIDLTDGKYLMWGGNAILQHNGTQTYMGDNTSSSVLTLTGGDATFTGGVTIGPGTTGSAYDSTTFVHVKGTTRSIVQQSSTDDAYYMFGDAGANNAAWVGYSHSSGTLSLQSQTNVTINKNTAVTGNISATGTVTANAFSGDGSSLTGITATDSSKVAKAGDTMTGALNLNYSGGGGQVGIDIHNTGTNTADDAKITFETQGQYDYILGIDRSASKFKISRSSAFGTNDVISLDSNSDVLFASDIQASGIYVGSTNTSYDFYNNGTSYFNGAVTIDDNLTVTGNLTITGDIDSYSVNNLDVVDKLITVGKGQTEANSNGSGILVDGSNASLLWDESNNTWDFNKSLDIVGNIGLSGTVDGRNIANDGTKLDTIATNADVTPSWVPSSDPSYLTSSSTQSKYLRSDADDTATGVITFDGGSLGNTNGNTSDNAIFKGTQSNNAKLIVRDVRTADGTDWTNAGKRLQMRIDSTDMGYIQFNGTGNNYGISMGTSSSSTERFKITSAGAASFTGSLSSSSFDVTNNITVGGTVDGRDIATDGTKLDTIATNADVTPSWVPSSNPNYLTSSSTQSKYLRSDTSDTTSGNLTINGNLTVDGTTFGLYHGTVEDDYYFDSYNGSKHLAMIVKNSRSDIIRYQSIDNLEYWNGSSWQDMSSQLANVKKLLDGRQDTMWAVPSTYYKFRFTVSPSTVWPLQAKIGQQLSWSGSQYPGSTILVEEDANDGNGFVNKVTANFGGIVSGSQTPLNSNNNGITGWGLMFQADSALHTGKGGSQRTRITVDYYGWSPSNSSHVTIPLQNLFITSNYAGTENTDYTNLLDYDRNITTAGDILPDTDNAHDLGSSSKEFKDGYFDGTVYLDGINLDGNTISGVNDSDEFDDDDAHIMTSAGIDDRISTRISGLTSNAGTVTGTGADTRLAVWSSNSALNSDSTLLWRDDNSTPANKELYVGGRIIPTLGVKLDDGASHSPSVQMTGYSGGSSHTWQMYVRSSSQFAIQKGSDIVFELTTDGNLTLDGTIDATNFSGSSTGTNTGDQDISGIATNATAISNITSFPGFGTTNGTALQGDTTLFSGAYADLTGKPTIPSGDQIIDWTAENAGTIHTSNYVDNNTWIANSSSAAGYVASGSGQANKVWKTNASGVPAWRADANTTYSSSDFTHDDLNGFVANEHIDWTASGAGTIHASNISFPSDNNTFRTVEVDSNGNDSADSTLGSSETLRFKKGSNISIDENSGVIEISSTNTTYSAATSSALGLVKIGYSENGKNYPVELASDKMYVNVPWTDNNTTYSSSDFNHDDLTGFVANEHIDWTADQGSTNIHSGNYTNTTYSVGDGGLTQNNFTNALKTKLDGIADDATNVTNNNQISNGAGYITSFDITTQTDSRYLRGDVNDNVAAHLTFNDSKQARFGTGGDYKIQHNGTNAYMDNHTGHLYIRNNATSDLGKDIYIQAKSGEASIYAFDDADVELYYNNSKKFSTTSSGFECNGTEIDTSSNGGGYKIGFNVADNFSFSGYDVAHYGITNAGNDTGGGIVLSGYFGIRFATNGAIRGHFANTGTFTTSGDIVGFGSPSDISLKENIKPIDNALDKVCKLKGVTFDWKESDSILEIKEDIGFIAQDVQEVLPELIKENDNGKLSLRDKGIVPVLVEAIKELKAEIDELKKCNKCKNCNCNA